MTIEDKLDFLRKKFLECAVVNDVQKGYVVVEDFNLAIDPDVLQIASRCWAERFHRMTDINAIVGLPDAGARLVSILGEMLRVKKILPSKRSEEVPGAWTNVASYQNKSFTMNVDEVKSHIGFVNPGTKILLIDDVVAYGETAIAAIEALQAKGVEVMGMAVLFDKTWQGGIEKIKQKTGVEVYSLISIKSINIDGSINL